jgi:hypothetical protein
MKTLWAVALVAVAGCGGEEKKPPVTSTPPKAKPVQEKEVAPAPKSEPEVAPAPKSEPEVAAAPMDAASTKPSGGDTAAAPEATAGAETTAAVKPAAAANPAIAEFAPLWPEIAKCEEHYESDAAAKCGANFKLQETVKAAYEGKDKDGTRLRQVHEALVDQVVTGEDLQSRKWAAFADWSKTFAGGTLYGERTEADAKHALALLEAIKKLEKEDQRLGYEIANMLGGWWKQSSEVRTAMMAVLGDKATKSTSGRAELMRHASWTTEENAELVPILKSVAADTGDNASVREHAIDGLSRLAGDLPELVDLFLRLTGDADGSVVHSSVNALGSAKPDTDAGKKAQAKLLELALAGTPEAPWSARTLGKVGNLEALATVSKHYKSNAGKPEVNSLMSDAIEGYVYSHRFKEDAAADAAFRKAVDAMLKDKVTDNWDLRDMMGVLGELGGKKSAATCEKYMKDKDSDIAAAATKCVEKSAPAK